MKNTLNDLNNHIFAALERLNDEDLTGEDLESEIKRSEAVSKLAESAVKAHPDDAGFDLALTRDLSIGQLDLVSIKTGVHVLIPPGYLGQIQPRSSMTMKAVLCMTGIIDAGYTGEIEVALWNVSNGPQVFRKGERIAQLVILPKPEVELVPGDVTAEVTARGDNGFGSSGR